MNLKKLKRLADRALADHQLAMRQLAVEECALSLAKKQYSASLKAQAIVQRYAAAIQHKAHAQITAVVTRCLQTVFDPSYEFRIEFARKRGKTEARMHYKKNGIEIDPVEEDGGGVLDWAALALRISCLLLATPRRRKALLLDEPLKNVHGEIFRERSAAMIQALAKDLGIQIIMATGLEWLWAKADKVIQIGG